MKINKSDNRELSDTIKSSIQSLVQDIEWAFEDMHVFKDGDLDNLWTTMKKYEGATVIQSRVSDADENFHYMNITLEDFLDDTFDFVNCEENKTLEESLAELDSMRDEFNSLFDKKRQQYIKSY